MESGPGGWYHSGTNDLWDLTDYRSHSGSTSWYCGTTTHHYMNLTDATLWSPTFVTPEDATLSFWCYFDVTIYGTDGLFIEVKDEGDWQVVDYLGSGGALDSLLFACDWAEHTYELLDLTPGSETQIRFRLVTDDSDYDEGFYIDDVTLDGAPLVTGIGATEPPAAQAPDAAIWKLSPTAPNPVLGTASWRLSLPAASPVTARIYDPHGRLIRQLLDLPLAAGEHAIRWDGQTLAGERAAAGIYFLRIQAGEVNAVRKIVRVRR
jgi:hypothetical protein